MKRAVFSLWVTFSIIAPAVFGATRKVTPLPAQTTIAPVSAAGEHPAALAPSLRTASDHLSAAAIGTKQLPSATIAARPDPLSLVEGFSSARDETLPEVDLHRAIYSIKTRATLAGSEGDQAKDALALAEEIIYLDKGTGLPNRRFFEEKAADHIRRMINPILVLLDMDRFGPINFGFARDHGEVAGHKRGNEVLAVAGARFSELADSGKVIAIRLGGEEFVFLADGEDALNAIALTKAMMPPNALLDAVGATESERKGIQAGLERIGAPGEPVGGFTFGISPVTDHSLHGALNRADEALNRAKQSGRGRIFINDPAGGPIKELAPPVLPSGAARLPARPQPRKITTLIARLKTLLTSHPDDFEKFLKGSFRDTLTGTRTEEYLELNIRDWARAYAQGGQAVILAARDLKLINDLFGHAAGDLFLHKVGEVIRKVIKDNAHLDVREPVRFGPKEFVLVGKDAKKMAEAIDAEFFREFHEGRILPIGQVHRFEDAVRARLGPGQEYRWKLIGNMRVVSEDLTVRKGRADIATAIDNAFVTLSRIKGKEAEEDTVDDRK